MLDEQRNVLDEHELLCDHNSVIQDIAEHNFHEQCFCALCLHLKVVQTGAYNFQQAQLSVYSELKTDAWFQKLENYHDKIICSYLQYGWPINFEHDVLPVHDIDNHSSAYSYMHVVDDYITTELEHGAIIGPIDSRPFHGQLVISPLQTVQKDSQNPHKRRVVLDLSFPPDLSVNSGIPRNTYLGESFRLRYPTVDSLAELICQQGQGCYMFKLDLSRAYRQIPVDPRDYILLGFQWRSSFYIDCRLPFGLASSAMACQRTTNAVTYMFNQMGHPLINYLDDFASAQKNFYHAVTAFYELRQLLMELGLQESSAKAVFPCQIMIFLGVLFNSVTMTMEVIPSRLQQIKEELQLWGHRKVFASKQQIQQLIGKLQFVAKCVKPGRLFIARMLDTLRSIPHNKDRIRLPSDFKADIFWWQKFIETYNGVSLLGDTQFSRPGQVFSTDSCLTGCGGVCGVECFATVFPIFIMEQDLDINSLELLTVVVACKLWGKKWAGQRILVECDNEVTTRVINYGRSRSYYLNKCARELLYVAAIFEFDIRAVHIPGRLNIIPDKLSRGRLSEVLHLYPSLQPVPCDNICFQFQHHW